MSENEKLDKAMDLLNRAAEHCSERAPDVTWFEELFALAGQHMILTDEGWQHGENKQSVIEEYGEDAIEGEINAPVRASR